MKTLRILNWSRSRWTTAVIACTAAVATFSRSATAAPSTTAQVSEVAPLELTSGNKAAVTYKITHDIQGHLEPNNPLPGARVARTDYPSVYDGVWGINAGQFGAWLSPQGNFYSQFSPVSQLIESTYFTNRLLDSTKALPLEAGDYFELVLGNMLGNAPLPSDRQRGPTTGVLGWDHGVLVRQVSATYNGTSASADVLVFRADLVVRGGDLDARNADLEAPPLVIDLPRTYPVDSSAMYIVTDMFPYTSYIGGFHLEVLPETGKAILTASVQGYLFEAKEYALPGGGQANEWHLPLTGVVMLTPPNGALAPHAATQLPQGGRALANDGRALKRLAVPAGGAVETQAGVGSRVLDAEEKIVPAELSDVDLTNAGMAESGSPVLIDELKAVAPINSSLASPVDLVIGNKTYGLTIDPDFRGEGVLALRSVRRVETANRYANVITIPYAVIDGTPIELTRSRLLDLRVLPVYKGITLTYTGQAGEPSLVRTRTLEGSIFPFGLTIDAVYDLGDRRYAFLQFVAKPDLTPPDYILSQIRVRSIDGQTVPSVPVQYLELPEVGPVNYGGTSQGNEFAATVDLFSTSSNTTLVVGSNHEIAPSILQPGIADGLLTVLNAPAPLSPNPAPDPAKSIVGQPLAFYYTPPAGAFTQSSIIQTALLSNGPAPIAYPQPIGQLCGNAQVRDVATPDAPLAQDIQAAWFDADDANLYATIQVTDVPAAAPPGSSYSWALFWRYQHSGRYARATLDSAGQWTFDTGGFNIGAFFPLLTVSGDVQSGANGYIRVAIPRSFLRYRNGELLRDTSAHSYIDTSATDVDRAPEDTPSDASFGTGTDYVVGPACGPLPVQLAAALSRKTHGSAGTYDVDLPLDGSGIECRSGGAGGDHTMVFRFAKALTSVGSASVTSGNGTVGSGNIDSNDARNYIVNLTGVSNAQVITVTLSNVADSAGNSSSAVSASMGVLLDDANGNRAVSNTDVASVKAQVAAPVTASNFRNDVTANGIISNTDVSLTKAQVGTQLP
jgi:hypothetical protein